MIFCEKHIVSKVEFCPSAALSTGSSGSGKPLNRSALTSVFSLENRRAILGKGGDANCYSCVIF